MNDFLLEILCEPAREEEILARLFLTRSTGSTTDEESDRTSVTAYFDSAEERDEAAGWFGDVEVRKLERERQDWLQLYQQLLRPIFIGNSFVVAPDAGDHSVEAVFGKRRFQPLSLARGGTCRGRQRWIDDIDGRARLDLEIEVPLRRVTVA